MRIISGNFKNKKLFEPSDNYTRPLKDLVKESIFNIIEHSKLIKFKIENCEVLDLFSGSGSFGLECISRGAEHVTFFENYTSAINILKKNIENFNCESKTKIINKNISSIELKKLNKSDLIFMDPPFKYKGIGNLIKVIKNINLLKNNGVIILHRHKNNKEVLPLEFKVIKKINYGISNIFFGY